jgi:esterase/lipase superfamily enzyme
MKYALGLNPNQPALSGLPVDGQVSVSGKNYLTLTFTDQAALTDITYTVQVSSDLQTGSPAPLRGAHRQRDDQYGCLPRYDGHRKRPAALHAAECHSAVIRGRVGDSKALIGFIHGYNVFFNQTVFSGAENN